VLSLLFLFFAVSKRLIELSLGGTNSSFRIPYHDLRKSQQVVFGGMKGLVRPSDGCVSQVSFRMAKRFRQALGSDSLSPNGAPVAS